MAELAALAPGDPARVGPYTLVARLGAGGMGRVYLARSRGGRSIAVKVVRPELAEDTTFRSRFAREVAAARRVSGAFTADVVDADPESDPAWLATSYVPGPSLAGAVTGGGPWPAGAVWTLGAGLAEALAAIHAAGVVHRDLKPSNVLLAPDGPRVIDFGISVAAEASALTRTGTAVGTPGFMAPEQLTGARVGPACDVFSLGAVLAFTARGEGPFGTGPVAALTFRAVHEPPDLAGLPPALRAVVERCLAKAPDDRPTVAELLELMAEAPDATPLPAFEAPRTPVSATGPGGTAPLTTADPGPHDPWSPPDTATRPETGAPRVSRRSALLRLAGAAAVGAGAFAGWRLLRPPGNGASWSFTADGGSLTPPVLTGGVVVVRAEDGTVCARDAATGEERWSVPVPSETAVPPGAVNGAVYLTSGASELVCLDARTGEERWTRTVPGATPRQPVTLGSMVLLTTSEGLHALDTDSGEPRWTAATSASTGAPTSYGDIIYVPSHEQPGSADLCAVDSVSGEILWRWPGQPGSVISLTASVNTPATNGDIVCFAADENMTCLDAATGDPRWTRPVAQPDSVPVVVENTAFICEQSDLVAVDTATGEHRWTHWTDEPSAPSAVTADSGRIYFSGMDFVHVLDAGTGEPLGEFSETPGGIRTRVAVGQGLYYVAHLDRLFAVPVPA